MNLLGKSRFYMALKLYSAKWSTIKNIKLWMTISWEALKLKLYYLDD